MPRVTAWSMRSAMPPSPYRLFVPTVLRVDSKQPALPMKCIEYT